jgi:uncharacterized cysteine cluster protein YcgN (CxxCxxCC family)
MKKTIPAKEETYCDVCGRLCVAGGASRNMDGELVLKRKALDDVGRPCADATVKKDLCDDCLSRIEKAINEEADKIWGGVGA